MCTDLATPEGAEERQAHLSLGAFNPYKLAGLLLQTLWAVVPLAGVPGLGNRPGVFGFISVSYYICVYNRRGCCGMGEWDRMGLAVPLTILGFELMVVN